MSLLDYFFTNPNNTQTPDQAQANYSKLQAQLKAQTDQRVAAGDISPQAAAANYALATAGPLQDPGSAALDSFWKSITFQNDPNDPNPSPGIGSVIMDVLVLALIGGGIWAFFKFGGTGLLKTLAKKNKYYAWGIIGAVLVLLLFIYSRFKKTASDTTSTAQGVADGLKAINPFA